MKTTEMKKISTIDKTPEAFQCVAVACPSVFETDRETYIIIGKKINIKEASLDVLKKIGDGEIAIEVPKGLLNEMSKGRG